MLQGPLLLCGHLGTKAPQLHQEANWSMNRFLESADYEQGSVAGLQPMSCFEAEVVNFSDSRELYTRCMT